MLPLPRQKLARQLHRRLPAGLVSRLSSSRAVRAAARWPRPVDPDLTPEQIVDLGHRLLLGRPADPALRAGLVADLTTGATAAADVLAMIASSPEFLGRIRHQAAIVAAAAPLDSSGLIDVADLRDAKSVEEHNEAADRYFAGLTADQSAAQLAKPFSSAVETPELLTCFGHMVAGLRPMPGMVVLDFGVGSGWTSWYFAQLGCQVIASDVSPAALRLVDERFRRWPTAGTQPAPRLLRFDGRRFELADDSVDRICTFDAFHHLVNQAEVLREFARVLKPGGLAGFDEPGRHHSQAAQAQHEMREFGVVEGDIDLAEMATMAASAGLEFVAADVLTVSPIWAPLEEFNDLVETRVLSSGMQQQLARQIENKQLFLLRKPGIEVRDSRDRNGLKGTLVVQGVTLSPGAGGLVVDVVARVRNTGTNLWLPSATPIGGVSIGVRAVGSRQPWEARIPLPADPTMVPGAGGEVSGQCFVPSDLEVDSIALAIVSERVGWLDDPDDDVPTVVLSGNQLPP